MTLPTTCCMRVGCTAPARYGLKLGVPAMGVPIHSAPPLEVIVGVRLCAAHTDEATAADYLVPKLRKACTQATVARGMGLPDFDSAMLLPLPLDGVEWAMFERRQQEGPLS